MRRDRYVYLIYAGSASLPFYVGVGKEPTSNNRNRRELQHAMEARRGYWKSNEPKNRFILDCINRGFEFRYEYERGLTADQAHAREVELIAFHGRRDLGTGCLLNACCGGWGSKEKAPSTLAKMRAHRHTEETRARIARSHIGMKQPETARAKIKAARAKQVMPVGEAHPRYGTGDPSSEAMKFAEASRRCRGRQRGEDISLLSRKGKPGTPLTPEHKAKLIASNKSRIISAETRAKMSAAAKARKPNFRQSHSEETKAKMRAAKLNRKHSKETRALMCASQAARRAAERTLGAAGTLTHSA